MADIFVDPTSAALAKTLDGCATRDRVLAHNIANAETPGFTRADVSFEEAISAALSSSDNRPTAQLDALSRVEPTVQDDLQTPRRPDGNNVEMEREMAALAENSLQFDSTAQMLAMKLRVLRLAIREGRR